MFAITEGTRRVYGKEITTYTREIYSANVLEVEAGTNGFQGGDSGHGSRTYIRIEDMGSTDIRVNPLGRDGDEGFELFLGGLVAGVQVGVVFLRQLAVCLFDFILRRIAGDAHDLIIISLIRQSNHS